MDLFCRAWFQAQKSAHHAFLLIKDLLHWYRQSSCLLIIPLEIYDKEFFSCQLFRHENLFLHSFFLPLPHFSLFFAFHLETQACDLLINLYSIFPMIHWQKLSNRQCLLYRQVNRQEEQLKHNSRIYRFFDLKLVVEKLCQLNNILRKSHSLYHEEKIYFRKWIGGGCFW